jgi:hypothetical protein
MKPPCSPHTLLLLLLLLLQDASGATQLLTSNVGDARILLVRGGKAVQLTVDHVPDRWAAAGCCLQQRACTCCCLVTRSRGEAGQR